MNLKISNLAKEKFMSLINKLFYSKNLNRSNILINPRFQLSIINYVALLFIFVIAVFYILNIVFYYLLKQKGVDAGLLASSEYFLFLNKVAKLITISFVFVSFISLIVIYYFGLRLSHRIAGPIYKIDMKLDEMIETNTFQEIKLRNDDYFQDTAKKINDLLQRNS